MKWPHCSWKQPCPVRRDDSSMGRGGLPLGCHQTATPRLPVPRRKQALLGWRGSVLPSLAELCGWLQWFVTRICVAFAGFLGPAIFALQMGALDMFILQSFPNFGWLSFVLELVLLVHMLLNAQPTQVVRSGSMQWIIYSWLIAAKIGVIYFKLFPTLTHDDALSVRGFICLTPVFYCVVTFRTLRQVFRGLESDSEDNRCKNGKRSRPWGEHGTLDVLLLQDMVWHVVIDMMDMTVMLPLANVEHEESGVNELVLMHYPAEVNMIKVSAGVFLVLGMFFHQQSFPGVIFGGPAWSSAGWLAAANETSGEEFAMGKIGSLTRSASRMFRKAESGTSSQTVGKEERRPSSTPEYGVDVMNARKRSAIVSILLVDLPFCVIRTSLYVLSLQASHLYGWHGGLPSAPPTANRVPWLPALGPSIAAVGNATTSIRLSWSEHSPETPHPSSTPEWIHTPVRYVSGPVLEDRGKNKTSNQSQKPRIDKWWIKNVVCLFLQAMQLRFVQRADFQHRQRHQWMAVHRSEKLATQSAARRRRRSTTDRAVTEQVRHAWQEFDRTTSDAQSSGVTMARVTSHERGVSERWTQNDEANVDAGHHASLDLGSPSGHNVDAQVPEGSVAIDMRTATSPRPSQGRWGCKCTPRRQRERRQRCWNRCWCRQYLHVGGVTLCLEVCISLIFGWFLAKTDFNQMLAEVLIQLA